ncbi:MAG: TRIC cation channel family protein [Bacillota bacterium]|nr:TRIC cation channel family protein [Bacillota bacterium]
MEINTTMFVLEILGTVAFAVSGALAGIKKEMDILGVAIIAIVTATAGGAIRDITLGITPPSVFRNPIYLIIVLITVAIFMFGLRLRKINSPLVTKPIRFLEILINLSDAIGLGVFTVSGVSVAISNGYGNNIFLVLFVGTITGVGGGILRDVFTMRIPSVFVRHIYALASMIGALIFFILRTYIYRSLAMVIAVAIIVIIRFISHRYKLSLPKIKF